MLTISRNIFAKARSLYLRLGVLVLCVLMLSACGSAAVGGTKKRYTRTFTGTFDTVIQFTAYADTEVRFGELYKYVESRFTELSKQFDNFYSYDGLVNVYNINSNAGLYPVKVPDELYRLLERSISAHTLTSGYLDVSLGSVYGAWKNFINGLDIQPKPPTAEQLAELGKYGGIQDIELNAENRTVFLRQKGMELDLGATAKGYAVELVSDELRRMGCTEFIISAGGNVSAGSYPAGEGKRKWTVSVKDPSDTKNYLMKLAIENMSVVTSGNYERYRMYDGVRYHHIIDPKTLAPSNHFSAVTVIAESSADADIYSTAIFSMPYDQGLAFASDKGLAVLWVMPDGKLKYTDSFESFISK